MKLVLISDTHNFHRELFIPDGDVIIHAGDWTTRGDFDECRDFIGWFCSLPHRVKIFIGGNHEVGWERNLWYRDLKPDDAIYLENTSVTIEGFKIYGSPYTPAFGAWAFMYHTDEQAEGLWSMIPDDTDILVTHGPVYKCLDWSPYVIIGRDNQNVGCPVLRKHVDRVKPKLHVAGHIHEGYGELKADKTRFINASICNGDYEAVNRPMVVDTDTWEVVNKLYGK
jgi:predicted phosphodiesterase